jgi:hypothetical protein
VVLNRRLLRWQPETLVQLPEGPAALPFLLPGSAALMEATLVLTANCTRQCLGLPRSAAGPKVTAEEVIAALRILLPDHLQFLISDRGTHFTAHQFAVFAQDEHFVPVLIARHRSESNGIAERFVRTLKVWLADHAWEDVDGLARLLEQFRAGYNDPPHQGLPLPGLSPNEFAARFWLLSRPCLRATCCCPCDPFPRNRRPGRGMWGTGIAGDN